MRSATFRHTEITGELTALRSMVSSATELGLGRSPGETIEVEVMNEMVATFRRREELCLPLEGPGMKICTPFIEPPTSQT
jgi:hypothetical protein